MKNILLQLVSLVFGLMLRLRYRISYQGLDEVKDLLKSKKKGCLFLPNHPAVIIDPLVISVPLVRLFHIRPLIVEYMYYHPAFHWCVRLINAIPIPNFGSSVSPLKLKRAERSIETISSGLKKGDRFLIYPAGTTKHQAKEVVGGAFAVHKLVQDNPKIPVVLVRMTGLWGSSFSRAATHGGQVNSKEVLKKSFWALVKNCIFFMPRRDVLVQFEIAKLPENASKDKLNEYLENWYNKPFGDEGEPLSLVSYAFWKNELLEISKVEKNVIDVSKVDKEVAKEIIEKIAELAKVPAKSITPESKLIADLGLDSLDHAELITYIAHEYSISGISPEKLVTVANVLLYADGQIESEEEEQVDSLASDKGWNNTVSRKAAIIPEGTSIPEVFFNSCDEKLKSIACTDPVLGAISYAKCKKLVLIFTKLIANLKGKRVGILLPSSTMSYMLVIACQMANKTPVMINWTVGPKHLKTVLEVSEIKEVLTSWAFLDALDTTDISLIEPLLVMLEEIKTQISIWDVVKASLASRFKAIKVDVKSSSEAVVLFTSGTEGMPKGVPLTHANILSDLRGALKLVALHQNDKLLAMLPPFHSFGFTVTGLLPLLAGFRVAYYPNPTDAKALAHAIDRLGITVICSAPTFLKNIMDFSETSTLTSLRKVISGAEKASDDLIKKLENKAPKALFIEGYGITECSPILCANVTGDRKKGVGQPIHGVSFKIIDPDIDAKKITEKNHGEVGLILASGPNVFSGYLNKVKSQPFIEIDDKKWYDTGDLGLLDEEGNLILSGRLKRFVKIGGEMVSLGAIEEVLMHHEKCEPNHFVVVPNGDVLEKASLILFTTYKYTQEQVNQLLRKGGLSNLVKIDKVIHVDTMPMTGTGKIAYRELDKLVQ
ncbi:MAG: AMP-binding protein [Chlamydiales bacterium]|nr:AMP-binding protein [Chlamydiales bacterium]